MIENATRSAMRASERLLSPAPHLPKEQLKADVDMVNSGSRTSSFRSYFAIGKRIADSQKVSIALHAYELTVRHSMPENQLNFQSYHPRDWIFARSHMTLARTCTEAEYLCWQQPSQFATSYTLGTFWNLSSRQPSDQTPERSFQPED